MPYSQTELQETLKRMQALISKAQAVAEPILEKWDGEAILFNINRANMETILDKKCQPNIITVPVSTHHSSNGRT